MEAPAQLQAIYTAWGEGELDPFLARLAPDVRLHTSGYFPDFSPVYRGLEGIAEFWRNMREPWEEFTIEIEEWWDVGDGFVVRVRFRARGIGSGAAADLEFFHAVRFTDEGLLRELHACQTEQDARDVFG